MKFRVIENGQEIECDILLTFSDDNNNLNYIVYTDGTKDNSGELEVYASRYEKKGEDLILMAIEHESEWNLIDNMLEFKFRGND